jgi:hypothetical protein
MADAQFFEDMNSVLPDMEQLFGETWTLERTGQDWPALAIDRETTSSQAMSGGQYVVAHTMIFVAEEVFSQSGVKKGDIVIARGDRFELLEIDKEGDKSRALTCGPVAVKVWR